MVKIVNDKNNCIFVIVKNYVMKTFFRNKSQKENDFDKIKVTSNGTFFMKSSDIFDDKDSSLKLIAKLRQSVEIYSARSVVSISKTK